MIGRIEPRSLKYNAYRLIYLTQRFLSTFRACHQWRVSKFLFLVKLHTAVFTPVRVDWHTIYYLFS